MLPSKEEKLFKRMLEVSREMYVRAWQGTFDGRMTAINRLYMQNCTYRDLSTETNIIFTRDTGHYSSGWMKNPDYEQCLHLSLSPMERRVIVPGKPQFAEPGWKVWSLWAKAFFKEGLKYVWEESPKSTAGQRAQVWHYRLFCNENWDPIKPRKEVYSKDFIELGWQSATERFEKHGTVIESTVDPN